MQLQLREPQPEGSLDSNRSYYSSRKLSKFEGSDGPNGSKHKARRLYLLSRERKEALSWF
jgi:hypothetical protein